jgi:hypothetical protein
LLCETIYLRTGVKFYSAQYDVIIPVITSGCVPGLAQWA